MAEKSRLAEILGVEEDEEFSIKGEFGTYRIHNGKRERKYNVNGWDTCSFEVELTQLINDPTLVQRKPRFSDEEMTVLRWLYKHGKLKQFCKTIDGRIGATADGLYGLAGNIVDYLLKPGETIYLDEMFKEDADND